MKKFMNNAVAFFVIGVVLLIIIPLSPVVLDIMFIFNIALSMMILLITMYTREPLQFSVFPSLLLITTLLRVALNVSSTRLILGNGGEAGQVIKTFGEFVIQGNAVVGFIVFIIIVIIQFVVITKGAERVAEVSARFTLDAMPGKQMAIDADLNSGLINEDTARTRRLKISREADFYGSMDGASKFVKGDAIISIIVLFVNIIGGVIIGLVMGGQTIDEVLSIYTIATVGDGLVSQLPALMISTATGMIVTRAASDNNLNQDITSQFMSQPIVLMITGGAMILLCLIPGFPIIPLIAFGSLLLFLGFQLKKAKQVPIPEAIEENEILNEAEFYKNTDNVYTLLTVEPLEVEFGYSLLPLIDEKQGGSFIDRLVMIRKQYAMDFGMVVPAVRIRDNASLAPNEYAIKIKGETVQVGEVLVDYYLALDSGNAEDDMEGIETTDPTFGLPAKWITEEQRDVALINGYTVIDPLSVIVTHLNHVIKQYAFELLGRKEVGTILDNVKKQNKAVVEDIVPSVTTTADLQKVLSNLLREQIPIKDMVTILETMGDYAPSIKDTDLLTEYVRQALKRTITRKYSDNGKIKVITLDAELENLIMGGVKKTDHGSYLAIEPEMMQRIVLMMSKELSRVKEQISEPVILSSPVVRIYFKKLIDQFLPNVVVLSFSEIDSNVTIQAVGTVKIG